MTENPPARVAAFFDLDNTLVRGACLFHVGRGTVRLGYLSMKKLLSFGWQQFRFIRFGENLRTLGEVQDRALQLVAGLPRSELVGILPRIYRVNIRPRVWRDTVDLIRTHQRAGHEVWLATASPAEVADLFVRELGLTGSIATRLEVHDDLFTGRVLGHPAHGAEKALRVRALAEARGYRLEDCFAYSDSINDLPLMETVGHPVGINPDRLLRGIIHTRGWESRKLHRRFLSSAR
ncbi:MAG: HAD-IB family hydrolase [Microbacteriaceae bacterium]|jgi:HAD superfamily hydrolase (TIGR01490 family)|nr:HAD-IB family hydrolase [Microbacteriaceae bacterium]MCI1206871.1 HAD-IB family hydrolase [Microbacteriaceae bacterium]